MIMQWSPMSRLILTGQYSQCKINLVSSSKQQRLWTGISGQFASQDICQGKFVASFLTLRVGSFNDEFWESLVAKNKKLYISHNIINLTWLLPSSYPQFKRNILLLSKIFISHQIISEAERLCKKISNITKINWSRNNSAVLDHHQVNCCQ